MQKIILILLLVMSCILSSCNFLFSTIYGMKTDIELIQESEISVIAPKYNIPVADYYDLDTAFINFLYLNDTALYRQEIKNHLQPMQVIYFDTNGSMLSYHINCNVGGFPNLNWNMNNVFDVFPPKQQQYTKIDTIVTFDKLEKFLIPYNKTIVFNKSSYNYIAVVFWSNFGGRQSKRLIKYVQKNAKLAPANTLKIIYVNVDNFDYQLSNNSEF
jgi:hypothetical protein